MYICLVELILVTNFILCKSKFTLIEIVSYAIRLSSNYMNELISHGSNNDVLRTIIVTMVTVGLRGAPRYGCVPKRSYTRMTRNI